MEPWLYLIFCILLLSLAYVVFRRVVRREYLTQGELSWPVSLLQLLIFVGLMSFPYLYNPPQWALFWDFECMHGWNAYLGFSLILLGLILTFGTMAWFGLRRAFGRQTAELTASGPYCWSRNPQILGGYLLVIGAALQRPSLYALVWVLLYGLICHMMILTEEEYLRQQFGTVYDQYCAQVPRYFHLLASHPGKES
jgi:protein-S-isoprenylcysteine O-methyltransferase Ste14